MTDPRLAHDMAILDWARTILKRHDHGISASCTPACILTAEERHARRARIIADYEQRTQEPQ